MIREDPMVRKAAGSTNPNPLRSPRFFLRTKAILILLWPVVFFSTTTGSPQEIQSLFDRIPLIPESRQNLSFPRLAETWDEGIPLGNGLLGNLIWKQGSSLRFSLDRADLWDLRPIAEFGRPEFRFKWVLEQAKKGDYEPVQRLFDLPYERDPGPSKIPAGALVFPLDNLGEIGSVELDIGRAVALVRWKNGTEMTAFVHAGSPIGWFAFEGVPDRFEPDVVAAPYGRIAKDSDVSNSLEGSDLRRLDYPPSRIEKTPGRIRLFQEGWNGFSFEILVVCEKKGSSLTGWWTIRAFRPGTKRPVFEEPRPDLGSFQKELESHGRWWKSFWEKSSIRIPDPLLEAQWYREIYKLGSVSRQGAPPVSLQAVWTADNGRLPPWKGDYHHDLNTELSYWPCPSSNHLEQGLSFLDWLWNCRPEFEQYTRTYFDCEGLNVPGVTALDGKPLGGWIQYSLSPTVSAWLAHSFYMHWRYSQDREFLETRAYPWIRDTARFLEAFSVRDSQGKRKLPMSSSPEIHDNRISAWFFETTNYDLALIRWTLKAVSELAAELGRTDESVHWETILDQWPDLALSDSTGALLLAPGIPWSESHRHFSHLLAVHPLGLITTDTESDRRTLSASLLDLDRLGTDWWCGYSFAWLGNIRAYAGDGQGACDALRTFASCFCLPNSFHANGDQSKTGLSKFTYRPFTLEGNFAFAAGIQEMLLQSRGGRIRIFPAVPRDWENAGFRNLRAEGAFLVSAIQKGGETAAIVIRSEKGGKLRIVNPFLNRIVDVRGMHLDPVIFEGPEIVIDTKPGAVLEFCVRTQDPGNEP